MKKAILIISLFLTILKTEGFCQKGPNRFFGEPIMTDTLSTLIIPTRYNQEFFSANKIAFWGDYYANMLIYNYKTDSYKKLFEKDTFIESFRGNGNYSAYGPRATEKLKNVTTKWIFLLVKTTDTNKSGRIDERDPSVLFAVSTNGENLRPLTSENENVLSLDVFDKQGFALIKIQRDSDNDKSFKTDDKDYYYKKVSLTDLTLGKDIEIE